MNVYDLMVMDNEKENNRSENMFNKTPTENKNSDIENDKYERQIIKSRPCYPIW
ncbi:453_t:CDS:2, partial [Dentiscutata heterogama]